jgi:hypothetical protein
VPSELRAKAEMYETRASECEQAAREAGDGPQRIFYQVLADYYGELAMDFRGVLAKRTAAALAAE